MTKEMPDTPSPEQRYGQTVVHAKAPMPKEGTKQLPQVPMWPDLDKKVVLFFRITIIIIIILPS